MEVMLQWIDDLDDLLRAAAQLAMGYGYRLAAVVGVAAAACGALAVALGLHGFGS